MSSVLGRLDLKDGESHLESSPNKHSNGSKHISCIESEDAQETDGDSSGYIRQNVNEESKYKDDDKNLATALQHLFSESGSEVNIIPAIKGSREKHGKSLQKLSVSWAEDVYDPPPSIVSHTRSKKQQPQKSKSRDNMKKNGKKGQKGSSSSKDKKKQSSSGSSKQNRDKVEWATTQMTIVAASS